MPKTFILVGPNAGRTVALGGFMFEEGKCQINERDAEKVAEMLGYFYSAWPEEMAEQKQLEYEQSQAAPAIEEAPEAPEEAPEAPEEAPEAPEEAPEAPEEGPGGKKRRKG